MSPEKISGVFAFTLVCGTLLVMLVALFRRVQWNQSPANSVSGRIVLLVFSMLLAGLIFRPHEHNFQGLDSSAYRLMAKAFRDGRPFHDFDKELLKVPKDIRPLFLLSPPWQGRITRDRSFEIVSLDTCKTRPFFYPLLPLCMVGMDALLPGDALDYFVPFSSFLLCLALLAFSFGRSGWLGILIVFTLIIGSPLPIWLFRGCYTETLSGILVCMALLSWFHIPESGRVVTALRFFALGLAVSFHPVMMVVSLPVAGLMALNGGAGIALFISFLCFAAGLLPLIAMTSFVAAPYGELSVVNFLICMRYSSSIRPAFIFVFVALITSSVLLCVRNKVLGWFERFRWTGVIVSAFTVLALVVPAALATVFWESGQGPTLKRGLIELWSGFGYPFGLFCLIAFILLVGMSGTRKARLVLGVVGLVLPMFLYLKGAETMGLWSQRRLIVPYLIMVVCFAMPITKAISFISGGVKGAILRAIIVFISAVGGLWNMYHWPAPYIVQYEKGADAWVKTMLDRIGNKLTAVDYHPYSVPLATGGKSRVIGLSEFGFEGLPALSKWLACRAQEEEVLWLTAYANPGLEEGVILEPVGRETISLDRVRSKTALPAVRYARMIDVGILRVHPVSENDLLVMHKVFDKGPLGLRGPWGRNDITINLPNGNRLPACWSREGSGIIGPVPSPGESVRIRVDATAERHDGLNHQTLRFRPPWDGEALSLLISNDFTSVSGELLHPSSQTNDVSRTGIYRIYADTPYSPRKVGIKGFSDDLGALIHLIRIELVYLD